MEYRINKELLVEYMYNKGYTQKTMATELGITRKAFNEKINGGTYFKSNEMIQIAMILDFSGTDLDEVFFPEYFFEHGVTYGATK